MINFAIVVDNKVMDNMMFNESHPVGEKWVAAMRSNVKLIKSDHYQFEVGDKFINEEFYRLDEFGEFKKIDRLDIPENDIINYAAIIDDEVIGGRRISKQVFGIEKINRIEQAFNSDYEIIEAPNDVVFGWTYNENTFSPPLG